jgi:hypothetical protein
MPAIVGSILEMNLSAASRRIFLRENMAKYGVKP